MPTLIFYLSTFNLYIYNKVYLSFISLIFVKKKIFLNFFLKIFCGF